LFIRLVKASAEPGELVEVEPRLPKMPNAKKSLCVGTANLMRPFFGSKKKAAFLAATGVDSWAPFPPALQKSTFETGRIRSVEDNDETVWSGSTVETVRECRVYGHALRWIEDFTCCADSSRRARLILDSCASSRTFAVPCLGRAASSRSTVTGTPFP